MTNEEAILAFLRECDKFSTEALTKYVHKVSMFQYDLTIDDVNTFHKKTDIIRKMIEEKSNVQQQTKR